MSFERAIYEIRTQQGLARLIHKTVERQGTPILFVHGFGGSPEIWFKYSDSIGNYFVDSNTFDIWSLGFSNAISGDIQLLAREELYSAVSFIFKMTNKPLRIVAHSVGGIIVRYCVCPYIEEPYFGIEKLIDGVTLLSVPNHGTNKFKSDKIWNFMNLVVNNINFNRLFVQVLRSSELINTLNRYKPCLNPHIRWQNAISVFDHLIEPESMKFDPEHLSPEIKIEQKEFPCEHTALPLNWLLFNEIYPPIHRFTPVAKWIYDHILLKK